jgi:mannosyl-oligosaccharide alpha-1,2-mannosidase
MAANLITSRNGWGASAVDALSTAIVMELADVVDEIITYIPTIDYFHTKTSDSVSLFETTIRYLGGMLAGEFFDRPQPMLLTSCRI